ncbi:MAG: metal-dependent hydrolase [Burkholderiales bacterium]
MDTLTHALSGALLARCTERPGQRLPAHRRILAFAIAAAFPDVDYLFFLLDPLEFLNLHRGPTHSLILLPLWAWLLAVCLARILGGGWRVFFWPCAFGILAHIAGDVVTIYGTKLLFPLSDRAFGLGWSFDVNPYIAFLMAAGFVGTLVWRPLSAAGATLAAIVAFLVILTMLREQALAVVRDNARASGLERATVYAIPQPLSPFHWSLIVAGEHGHRVAYLDLLARQPAELPHHASPLRRMAASYRPADTLQWIDYPRFGEESFLAREAWEEPQLAPFRHFATLPALYRIDRDDGVLCVWFTDLRHVLPGLAPSFRYGMCRSGPGANWRPYRLRYFSENERQAL